MILYHYFFGVLLLAGCGDEAWREKKIEGLYGMEQGIHT